MPAAIGSRFKQAIAYRGRDGNGEWTDGRQAHLFHSRLSIVALDDGAQPMKDIDDRLTIVFNGEIYNYVELRAEYEKRGARFHTSSDTEVILEGYKLKGASVVNDFIGMFAFAIWDEARRELFLARDRLGKKPLYWTDAGDRFCFASTLDAFTGLPGWTGELSRGALDFYAAVGSFPLGLTAFRQARSLPPGATAVVRPGADPIIERYWRLDFSRRRAMSWKAALAEYEEILTDAVRLRLRADVPVALTFSGGVDSGTIAAVASRKLETRLACFTVDYHTETDPSEETLGAREAARQLGLDWHFLHFEYADELFPALDAALAAVDQPFNNVTISYSQRLYDAIRPHAKVVLSGNGADEIFLGYRGNEDLRRRDSAALPGPLRRLSRFLPEQRRKSSRLAAYQLDYLRANLRSYPGDIPVEEMLDGVAREIDACGVGGYGDLYTFMALNYYTCDANFRMPDIAGLQAQVEVRSPFLDHRMVEFAARLPIRFKIGDIDNATYNKLLPKRYYARHVADDLAWADKKGMGWNIRFGDSFARDPDFRSAYEGALQAVAGVGLDAERFRGAWDAFTRDKLAGVLFPPTGGVMMAGFMLGRWLQVHDRGAARPVADV